MRVPARPLLDAITLRAHVSANKAARDADKSATKLGQRHEGADRLADVKRHWVNEKAALRDAVGELLDALAAYTPKLLAPGAAPALSEYGRRLQAAYARLERGE